MYKLWLYAVSFFGLWDPSLVAPFSFRLGFPSDSDGKEYACNVGNPSSVPGSGQFPGERNGNSLSYSYLENSVDRTAWQVTVHGVAKSQTWLND